MITYLIIKGVLSLFSVFITILNSLTGGMWSDLALILESHINQLVSYFDLAIQLCPLLQLPLILFGIGILVEILLFMLKLIPVLNKGLPQNVE